MNRTGTSKQSTGILVLVALLGLSTACKSVSPVQKYMLQCLVADIFTQENLGGTVEVNGVSGSAGSTFSVENGQVKSLKVNIPGYVNGYVTAEISGEMKIIYDAMGYHYFSISKNEVIILRVIPDKIDTVLYGKCCEGTVKNWDKQVINIGVMKYPDPTIGVEPSGEMIAMLGNAIQRFNQAAEGLIRVNYIGPIETKLIDGITCYSGDRTPGHGEFYNGNIITQSYVALSPGTPRYGIDFRTYLAELTQTASGLTSDGGDIIFPYIGTIDFQNPQWVNHGELVVRLNQLLTRGMRISQVAPPAVQMDGMSEQYLRRDSLGPLNGGFDSLNPFKEPTRPHTYVVDDPNNNLPVDTLLKPRTKLGSRR